MTSQDKTQMVTLRVQVPTWSAKEAAQIYLPALIDAVSKAEVPQRPVAMSLRGASVGTVR